MMHLFTGVMGISVAAVILLLVRRDRLHVNHGISWVVVAAGWMVLGLIPGLIDEFAGIMGIAYPPVVGLVTAIGLIVIKMLAMDIERSKIDMRYQRLTQKVGMLEADLARLQESLNAPKGVKDTDSRH